MKTKLCLTFLILTAVVLLGACRKTSTNQNQNGNSSGTMQETVGGGAAPTGDKFYFRGAINYSLKIEMNLVRDGERIAGSYFYPRVGKNIDLKGTVSNGNVDLRESDETGKETGVFKGKWTSNALGLADIEGKWSRPDGTKETDFQVSQQPIELQNNVKVVPKVIRDENKKLRYSVDAEYPEIQGDTRFDKFNQEARAMINKDVAAFKSSETAEPEEGTDLPDETQTSTLDISYQIRFATEDLISVEFHEGQYSRGAAHGSSYTAVLNYDVKNGRKISLADLFNPKSNYLNLLSAYSSKALTEKLRKEEMLDEETVKSGTEPRADNYGAWAITRKGLWITFDPYQVAAYAAGPQNVLVPYSALKDIIKPDGPVGRLAG
ncbi:MAG TPA: DUF3298 domain-containing protein [Pyrinomonadaceae bacterium]|nr:DUF3298 domain-containing protein [Pyrinomonadaceae bacterium]